MGNKSINLKNFGEVSFSYTTKEPVSRYIIAREKDFPKYMTLKVETILCGGLNRLETAFTRWPAVLGFKMDYFKKEVSKTYLEALKDLYDYRRSRQIEDDLGWEVDGLYSVDCNMSILSKGIPREVLKYKYNSCALFNIDGDRIMFHWENLLNFLILSSDDIMLPRARHYHLFLMNSLLQFNRYIFIDDLSGSKDLRNVVVNLEKLWNIWKSGRNRFNETDLRRISSVRNRGDLIKVVSLKYIDWVNTFLVRADHGQGGCINLLWGLVRNIGDALNIFDFSVAECSNCKINIAINRKFCSDKCRKNFYNRNYYTKNTAAIRKNNRKRMKELREFYKMKNVSKA